MSVSVQTHSGENEVKRRLYRVILSWNNNSSFYRSVITTHIRSRSLTPKLLEGSSLRELSLWTGIWSWTWHVYFYMLLLCIKWFPSFLNFWIFPNYYEALQWARSFHYQAIFPINKLMSSHVQSPSLLEGACIVSDGTNIVAFGGMDLISGAPNPYYFTCRSNIFMGE